MLDSDKLQGFPHDAMLANQETLGASLWKLSQTYMSIFSQRIWYLT